MRVWLYSRVSTEEQAQHGLSILTQTERLHTWVNSNGHIIVGESVDAGISGKKPYTKRPDLLRFMQAIENGEKVDALVFCKLDRFFRSVKLYYQAIDIMDKHGVAWKAIDEDYETVTASGRMKVNIMLAVNENEADRTSERIKVINEGKVARGEVVTGAQPMGFKIVDRHLIHDENAPIVKAMFDYYLKCGGCQTTRDWLFREFGIQMSYMAVQRTLKNPLYKGQYRDNKKYCPSIVSPEDFDRAQMLMEKRATRRNQTGRVYLFSGLLVCKECGRRLTSCYTCDNGRDYYSYRCQRATIYKDCVHHKHTSERTLEQWLLAQMEAELARQEYEYQLAKINKPKKKIDRAAIQRKLDRLADLYVDGRISRDKYDRDTAPLAAQIAQEPDTEPTAPDFKAARKIIGEEFAGRYAALSRSERRNLWKNLLEKIIVDADGNAQIFFAV